MKSKKLGRLEAVTIINTLWNMAKVFDMLGIPELKRHMLEKFTKEYGLKERELNDKFALNLVMSQHALVEKAKERLINDINETMEVARESTKKFYKLFGVNPKNEAEILDFLTSKERMKEGFLTFAKRYRVDPYFYLHILPALFNKNILEALFMASGKKIELQDVKKVFAEMLREGLFIENNGYVEVGV